jgi:beta-fructofuranosidase
MRDPAFPALHIRPERGWLNDPNGVCRWDGVYHVFFQYNPASPLHGNVHWGHVSSTDLVRWQEHPVALVPRPGRIDGAGCWSGCIVDDDGVPTAVYTANPEHAWQASVGLARGDASLVLWTQSESPVIGTPDRADVDEVRDPFVFTFADHRYAVQGAGQREGRPRLLLYDCDDLERWVELGPLLTDDDPIAADVAPANIWECPNLALVDGVWVLVVSLWRWVEGGTLLAGVRYLLGDLIPCGKGLQFKATAGGVLDDGPAFYAPQLMTDAGRTLLWGWAWEMGRTAAEIEEAGWAGVLTFPRELSIRNGRLCSRPAVELTALRRETLDWVPGAPLAAPAFEVVARGPVVLRLAGADGEVVRVEPSGSLPASILVDGSLVETFDDGRSATTRAYPDHDHRWLIEAAADDVVVYRLG